MLLCFTYFDFTNLSADYTIVKGAAVFNETLNVTVGKNNLTVPATRLFGDSGDYRAGILKNPDNEVILVFRVRNGSYANKSINYIMMLPHSPKRNLTYYLFQDIADRANCPYLFKQFIV